MSHKKFELRAGDRLKTPWIRSVGSQGSSLEAMRNSAITVVGYTAVFLIPQGVDDLPPWFSQYWNLCCWCETSRCLKRRNAHMALVKSHHDSPWFIPSFCWWSNVISQPYVEGFYHQDSPFGDGGVPHIAGTKARGPTYAYLSKHLALCMCVPWVHPRGGVPEDLYTIHLYIYLFVCLSVCLFVCLSVCVSNLIQSNLI